MHAYLKAEVRNLKIAHDVNDNISITSSSQELCQKTQCTRRRRRDLDPEGPAHLNRQDRAGELSQTVIYLQMAVTARLFS